MSAVAHPVLIETLAYFEVPSVPPIADETVGDLVHDLRQPLSSIEAIAYYLEMTLPAEQLQARHYMRKLQQLVDQADVILDRATLSVRKPPGLAKTAGAA